MQKIKLDQLCLSGQNMRQTVDDELDCELDTDVSTLAESLASQGLLNPLSVRPTGDGKYEVYAGHRRLLAARQLGWDTVDCCVSQIQDGDAKIRSLVENYQRRDARFADKILTFADIHANVCGRDVTKLCKTVGCRPTTVKRYLRLAELARPILRYLDPREGERRLTLKNADLLVDVVASKREPLITKMMQHGLSARETESVIRAFLKVPSLDRVDGYISEAIENDAKSRKPKRETEAERDEPMQEASDVESDLASEESESSSPSKSSHKTDSQPSPTMSDMSVHEQVNKQKPWLYDPSDKLRQPHAIPSERLAEFWKLYRDNRLSVN